MSFDIENRKKNHVDICLAGEVGHKRSAGFDKYSLVHSALPEMEFTKIDTRVQFLGKGLSMPLIISGMTGGTKLSHKINTNIAIAAEKCGVAFGVGSQRIAIEKGDISSFEVRRHARNTIILANLGAVQLNYGFGLKECKMAVDMIKADALVLHLNPLQEVIQDGNTDFSGLKEKIRAIAKGLGVPIIVKEVGFGISGKVADMLKDAGVYGIDVSGSGGTNWALIESKLAKEPQKSLGELFSSWGIPTTECLNMCKGKGLFLIAGGGIKNGYDGAISIVLGADYFTAAKPFLEAATKSPEEVVSMIEKFRLELKTAMFCSGSKDILSLKKAEIRQAF
ncbi:MAG: type 2 isopentenyl-diphosphate Delta-isomerase [Nanoarchaeota archaeon]|nr:type 2 isopentenyl-diphosphate Delta-isomerase [Nanoarchaeota archaeon]